MSETPSSEPELDWIQLTNELRAGQGETMKEKMTRKINENPFVPIGCLATAGALSYGLWAFRQGKRQTSQNMMRLRVAAQGFTVVALVVGVIMTA
ncbi:HIG1 domain family member 2A, mitochondrial, partial [Eumeta japonica]